MKKMGSLTPDRISALLAEDARRKSLQEPIGGKDKKVTGNQAIEPPDDPDQSNADIVLAFDRLIHELKPGQPIERMEKSIATLLTSLLTSAKDLVTGAHESPEANTITMRMAIIGIIRNASSAGTPMERSDNAILVRKPNDSFGTMISERFQKDFEALNTIYIRLMELREKLLKSVEELRSACSLYTSSDTLAQTVRTVRDLVENLETTLSNCTSSTASDCKAQALKLETMIKGLRTSEIDAFFELVEESKKRSTEIRVVIEQSIHTDLSEVSPCIQFWDSFTSQFPEMPLTCFAEASVIERWNQLPKLISTTRLNLSGLLTKCSKLEARASTFTNTLRSLSDDKIERAEKLLHIFHADATSKLPEELASIVPVIILSLIISMKYGRSAERKPTTTSVARSLVRIGRVPDEAKAMEIIDSLQIILQSDGFLKTSKTQSHLMFEPKSTFWITNGLFGKNEMDEALLGVFWKEYQEMGSLVRVLPSRTHNDPASRLESLSPTACTILAALSMLIDTEEIPSAPALIGLLVTRAIVPNDDRSIERAISELVRGGTEKYVTLTAQRQDSSRAPQIILALTPIGRAIAKQTESLSDNVVTEIWELQTNTLAPEMHIKVLHQEDMLIRNVFSRFVPV